MGARGARIVRFKEPKLVSTQWARRCCPYIHTPLADPERYQTIYAHAWFAAMADGGPHLP
jgi:hypothetical protein